MIVVAVVVVDDDTSSSYNISSFEFRMQVTCYYTFFNIETNRTTRARILLLIRSGQIRDKREELSLGVYRAA